MVKVDDNQGGLVIISRLEAWHDDDPLIYSNSISEGRVFRVFSTA
jgi:hypothetical protein